MRSGQDQPSSEQSHWLPWLLVYIVLVPLPLLLFAIILSQIGK